MSGMDRGEPPKGLRGLLDRLMRRAQAPLYDERIVAHIETPQDGSYVPYRLSVEGTHQNIPDNWDLWLVLYDPEADVFFPQPSAIMALPGGRWYTVATLGEDKMSEAGRTFEVLLLLLPRSAAMHLVRQTQEAAARGKSSSMPSVPRGGRVMDRVIVTRY